MPGKPKKLTQNRPMPLTRRRRDFKFMAHDCCEECSVLERALIEDNPTKFRITDDSILMFGESPFMVPLYLEFKRKNEEGEPCGYLSPCGVEMYSYESIYRYLKTTKSRLNVSQFVLTTRIELFRDREPFLVYAMRKDVSKGLEATPIQAINEYEPKLYDEFVYIKERKVPIDLGLVEDDQSKQCGCSCEGDCSDPEKCECRRLTVKENEILEADDQAGYKFNRLPKLPKTAIYECRSTCSCQKNCLNRVVQNGIKVKLQVFKTAKRGWGVRCLHDIPKGTFVCSYEGNVVKNTRDQANDNVYLMDLDYQYDYDQLKKNKSSTEKTSNRANEADEKVSEEASEKTDEKIGETASEKANEKTSKEASHNENKNEQVDGNEQLEGSVLLIDAIDGLSAVDDLEYSSDTSFSDLTETELTDSSSSECDPSEDRSECDAGEGGPVDDPESAKGDQEASGQPDDGQAENGASRKKLKLDDPCDYLLDCREFSNVSRFINHCCNPNLECQPVFIESRHPVLTHMALFALRDIKAFSELTMNYFDLSGNSNRNLIYFDCQCKSKKCISRNSKSSKSSK